MVVVEFAALAVLCWICVPPLYRYLARTIERLDTEGVVAYDWLNRHLSGREQVAVESTSWNVFGDKIRFTLPAGDTVMLRCFWPRTVQVSTLDRAHFHPKIGWIIDGRAPNGDSVRFFAWRVVYST